MDEFAVMNASLSERGLLPIIQYSHPPTKNGKSMAYRESRVLRSHD